MWEENFRELFKEKHMQPGSDCQPNPHSTPGGIRTEVPEGEGEARDTTSPGAM